MTVLKYTLLTLAGVALAGVVVYQVARRVEGMSGGDERGRVEAEVVTAVAAAAPGPGPDEALRGEMERLARENAELGAELAETRVRLEEHGARLLRTQEQLEELRRPLVADVLSSTLRAEVKSGEVVVTGGYLLPDGRRLYAFTTPTLGRGGEEGAVVIEARYLTLTDDAGAAVGLDKLATNAANTLQHGEVWLAEEAADVFELIGDVVGTDIRTAPRVTVRPGNSGMLVVGDTRLRVTPMPTGAGDGLAVELRLEQPQVGER